MPKEYKTKLEELITKKRLTRYEIAKRSGIDWSALNRYIKGSAPIGNMPFQTAARLSKVVGMTMEDFYNAMVEPIDKVDFWEGWNEVPGGMSVYVEDGMVVNGSIEKDGETVFAKPYYLKNKTDETVAPLAVKDFIRLTREGLIDWH